MTFFAFVHGPLLWFSLILLPCIIVIRTLFFLITIIKTRKESKSVFQISYIFLSFIRLFLPFHNGVTKRPVYAFLRYIFHICLFLTPLFLTAHIYMCVSSSLQWYWPPLPFHLSEWMTLIIIGFTVFFFFRRLILPRIRHSTSYKDWLLILIVILPYLSGYLLRHEYLISSFSFFTEHMYLIHVLTGEIMIITTAFLFVQTRLDPEKCTACGACTEQCPTGTLEFVDEQGRRQFRYSHYECLCCGTCVKVCPEEAMSLKHNISLLKFFQLFKKYVVRSAELLYCQQCGKYYMPQPQLEKLKEEYDTDYIQLCPECRRKTYLKFIHNNMKPVPKNNMGI